MRIWQIRIAIEIMKNCYPSVYSLLVVVISLII